MDNLTAGGQALIMRTVLFKHTGRVVGSGIDFGKVIRHGKDIKRGVFAGAGDS